MIVTSSVVLFAVYVGVHVPSSAGNLFTSTARCSSEISRRCANFVDGAVGRWLFVTLLTSHDSSIMRTHVAAAARIRRRTAPSSSRRTHNQHDALSRRAHSRNKLDGKCKRLQFANVCGPAAACERMESALASADEHVRTASGDGALCRLRPDLVEMTTNTDRGATNIHTPRVVEDAVQIGDQAQSACRRLSV